MAQQVQYFNGIRFALVKGGKYFTNTTLHKSMHRYVWEYYNGKIPKGFEIHHKDGNKSNNDISNLECIDSVEHKKLHGRNLTEEQREWRRKNVSENARPKAVDWHKSEQGLEWHKIQPTYRKPHELKIHVCEQCGKKFETRGKTKRFCSGACSQKYRRQNGLNNIEAVCEICGKTFVTDKYRPNRTCGKSCGVKLAWQEGKTGKIGNKQNNLF